MVKRADPTRRLARIRARDGGVRRGLRFDTRALDASDALAGRIRQWDAGNPGANLATGPVEFTAGELERLADRVADDSDAGWGRVHTDPDADACPDCQPRIFDPATDSYPLPDACTHASSDT